MTATDIYLIRQATAADAQALYELAELDSKAPLSGRILIAEVGDHVVAAISVADQRLIADPFERTALVTPVLRTRARAWLHAERVPSLRDRIRALASTARVSA